jgi:hypothetical protein
MALFHPPQQPARQSWSLPSSGQDVYTRQVVIRTVAEADWATSHPPPSLTARLHFGAGVFQAASMRTFHFPSGCLRHTAMAGPPEFDEPLQCAVVVAMVPDSVITTFSVFQLSAKSGRAKNFAHMARTAASPRAGGIAEPAVKASGSYIATASSTDFEAIAFIHASSACRIAASVPVSAAACPVRQRRQRREQRLPSFGCSFVHVPNLHRISVVRKR